MWLYYRLNLSDRGIEDLLGQRRIEISRESIRLWCNKFGPAYARRSQRAYRGDGDMFFTDEVLVKNRGKLNEELMRRNGTWLFNKRIDSL